MVDNDVIAFTGAPARLQPGLGSVKDGTVEAVIAWHPDRLHGSLREFEDLIAPHRRARVVASVRKPR